jgi:hypothetical protein
VAVIVEDREIARIGQLPVDRRQRLDLVRQVLLIDLARPRGQLHQQVDAGLPVAPDTFRPEPADGREPIERRFRGIDLFEQAGRHRLGDPLSPDTAS